jgi:hypothetical protein
LTRLHSLLRNGKLAPPAKDSARHYLWFGEDLERVLQALDAEPRGPTELPAHW